MERACVTAESLYINKKENMFLSADFTAFSNSVMTDSTVSTMLNCLKCLKVN